MKQSSDTPHAGHGQPSHGEPQAEIVFGPIRHADIAARHRLDALGHSGGSLAHGACIVRAGTPALRLNSRGWLALHPQDASSVTTHDARLAYCRAHLWMAAAHFSGPLRQFLVAYFDFLQLTVARRRAELETKLQAIGLPLSPDGYESRDWLFSGFLPLPSAHVRLSLDPREGASTFARFDCAFWTGRTLLAVMFQSHNMRRPSEMRAIEQLQQQFPLVECVHVSAPLHGGADPFAGRLGEALGAFADTAERPYGLFRLGGEIPPTLDDGARSQA